MVYEAKRCEAGQVSVLLAGVLVIALIAVVAIASIGQAMVHRARARSAADAVALASAVDDGDADALAAWYQTRGVTIERAGQQTTARSGPSQAAAWATTIDAQVRTAPALVAIAARAEQLVGFALQPAQWEELAVTYRAADAGVVETVASELGLCVAAEQPSAPELVSFELC